MMQSAKIIQDTIIDAALKPSNSQMRTGDFGKVRAAGTFLHSSRLPVPVNANMYGIGICLGAINA
jgi:hypothetical protein